jgi:DNA-binding Lrp family transcriptional regulator
METTANIDDIDRRILAELQTNARQTNKSLADAVGVAPSTALERVRLLEKRRVIRGYHADVDPAAVGGNLQAVVTIRLQPKTQTVIEAVISELWKLPEVIAINLMTGIDDLSVRVLASNAEHLRKTIVEGVSAIAGVAEERTSLLFDVRQKYAFDILSRG